MRVVLMLGLLAATCSVGAFLYAKYDLSDRVSSLARQAHTLCRVGRNGAAPDADTVERRFTSLADERDLGLRELHVVFDALDEDDGAEGKLQGTLAVASAGKLQMEATRVTVRARVHAEKWLWSVERDIAPSCMLRGRVKRVSR